MLRASDMHIPGVIETKKNVGINIPSSAVLTKSTLSLLVCFDNQSLTLNVL